MALKRTTVRVVCDEKDCESFTYMEQIKNWKCPLHTKITTKGVTQNGNTNKCHTRLEK